MWSDVCDARALFSAIIGGALVAAILFVLFVVWLVAAARDKDKKSCPRCHQRVAKDTLKCNRCGFKQATISMARPPGVPPPPPPPAMPLDQPGPSRPTQDIAERQRWTPIVSGQSGPSHALEDIAEGQRWIIYAIVASVALLVLNTAFFVAGVTVGSIGALLGLGASALAIIGALRLGDGFGYPTGTKVLLVIAMFIPLVGFLTMVLLNSLATGQLRAAGHTVGLLGIKR